MRKEYEFGIVGKIEREEDPMDPREWDNLGTMVCRHRNYNLGDTIETPDNYKDLIVLPLYLYDHSGITMSTKPFSCPLDSGQVGIIYVKKGTEGFSDEDLRSNMKAEVEEYNNFITGNVWCYTIENSQGEYLDSCCGFFGDPDYCEQQMEESVKYYIAQAREKLAAEQIKEVGDEV